MEIAVPHTEAERKIKTATAKRSLLWLGIVSMVMLFAGITSGYIVRQGEGKWLQFALPNLFIVSTLIIIISSATMQWALTAVKKNKLGSMNLALVLTTILGTAFVLFQYLAWKQLVAQGIYFVGSIGDVHTTGTTYIASGNETLEEARSIGNVAASFLYVITGLHVAHLLGGLLALLFVNIKAARRKYSGANFNGLRICATYWHFLTGLWIYLFLFLWYIR